MKKQFYKLNKHILKANLVLQYNKKNEIDNLKKNNEFLK